MKQLTLQFKPFETGNQSVRVTAFSENASASLSFNASVRAPDVSITQTFLAKQGPNTSATIVLQNSGPATTARVTVEKGVATPEVVFLPSNGNATVQAQAPGELNVTVSTPKGVYSAKLGGWQEFQGLPPTIIVFAVIVFLGLAVTYYLIGRKE